MNIFMTKLIAAMEPTTIIGIVVLGLLLIALFIYPSFANKKRQKRINELYKSVDVGDKIKTVGGVIGTVVQVNEINALESEFVLETGVGENKTTMVFDMQALYQNLTKLGQQRIAGSDTSATKNQAEEKDTQEK